MRLHHFTPRGTAGVQDGVLKTMDRFLPVNLRGSEREVVLEDYLRVHARRLLPSSTGNLLHQDKKWC
ncbi:hypothetical protein L6452_16241 [Arctium lappa]|uniref:Uncharacterized protein n=1 Tax=Arctium lappa TaxID=4217 RepID=A0ACB9C095_ARCLA|nr:hypothetical protein L6452_16241 [Arctium lappa]